MVPGLGANFLAMVPGLGANFLAMVSGLDAKLTLNFLASWKKSVAFLVKMGYNNKPEKKRKR